jgi:hypothetical protein
VNRMPFFLMSFLGDEFLFPGISISLLMMARELLGRVSLIRHDMDMIRSKCLLLYIPSHKFAVDESMIYFKGKVSIKVNNPMKPAEFRIKMFALSDSSSGHI